MKGKNTLEQRVEALEKKLSAMYQRTYAYTRRKDRVHQVERREKYLKVRIDTVSRTLRQLAMLTNKEYYKNGEERHAIFLTGSERTKLLTFLNTDYRTKKYRGAKWPKENSYSASPVKTS